MHCIYLSNLSKTYRRYEKPPGLLGSVKSLFHRQYTEKTAVSGFDLTIGQGEFVGVIGQNGAGKTTLIKLLTGIIAPTSGEISVLGHNPNRLENAFKRKYAVVMGQKSQLFFELTAADTFLLFKALYDIPDGEYRQTVDDLVDLFGVADLVNVQVRTLSLGERMKMELITALLHSPKILFLDEPTIGLDAVAQKQIRTFLQEVKRQRGTTILLTSHYIEDIKLLCPRSLVVEGGKKVYDGDTGALFSRFQTEKTIRATFSGAPPAKLPGYCRVRERSSGALTLRVPIDRTREAVGWLLDHRGMTDVLIEEEEIGTVVERIYREGVQ